MIVNDKSLVALSLFHVGRILDHSCNIVLFFVGMTQGVLPVLSDLGISGVSVGVNSATAPPAVPNIFLWKYGKSEVISMWHKGTCKDLL